LSNARASSAEASGQNGGDKDEQAGILLLKNLLRLELHQDGILEELIDNLARCPHSQRCP